ncbi:protein suppressor of hairy wing-like [Thrips palmi]|uniref:Protein suppressor of hairy wing-like n=1 Tax=Thrips palmi TaxID=161013 RepID=A0A6P8XZD7_THRPL|nr:protein suppressor of hairy wing-like [Thrips palmi]XP_034232503.1 protein suppressor of hairy wing-like [Thrips palmi]XP_034232504.1 protein suppressor of hairy wing-like [Thrips palmi]XP_034232505.1 protein suppressor of hairy wing-like [Thrips palmi]
MATAAAEDPVEPAKPVEVIPFYFKDLVDAEGKRVITRTKSLRYVCCICKKQFGTKLPCIKHVDIAHHIQVKEMKLTDTAHRDSPSNCRICSKTFSNQRNLYRHARKHHSVNVASQIRVPLFKDDAEHKREACPICDKTYTRISAVNRHIRRRHSQLLEDNQPGVVSCQFCAMKFPDDNSCSGHMSNYHHAIVITERQIGSDELLVQCTLCDLQFNDQPSFKEHLSCAHGEDLHEFCVHVTSESEEVEETIKTLNCDECHLSFTEENTWRCHMKEDHKAFPESCCQKCGDHSFKTVQELKCHLKDAHFVIVDKKSTSRITTPLREMQSEGVKIGLAAPEFNVLQKIPEWLVKHGDGKLLLAIYK